MKPLPTTFPASERGPGSPRPLRFARACFAGGHRIPAVRRDPALVLGLALGITLLSAPLGGCSAPRRFQADHALLVPWSPEAQDALPDPPYAARYEREGKSLVYVASRHEHRPGGTTFAVVSREFERRPPEVVVIEGLTSANGFSPEFYRDWVASMAPTDMWPGGEAAWSASLAIARDIPFIGGEPTPEDIRAGMAASPFDLHDLLCYFIVRQIPQWQRTGEDGARGFSELFTDMMSQLRRAYGLEAAEVFDEREFRRWYEEKNGRPFVYDEITTQDAAPLEGEDARYTNRISVAEDAIRNAHITDVIADMLNRFDRVLVVYGAGHHVQQAAVLRDLLGPPRELVDAR